MRAIDEGFFQQEIQRSAYEYQLAVESQRRIVVGVNRFKSGDHLQGPLHKTSERARDEQIARLAKIRQIRDNPAVDRVLGRLADAATTNENLIPLVLDCVEAYASVGEISNTLRRAWGEYKERVVI
jgi:methylmalonyl-CoA mutase N-terminal domain/subunit